MHSFILLFFPSEQAGISPLELLFIYSNVSKRETRTFHFSQVLLQHANRKASVGAAQGPHRSFCCRMFGDVPPAQINAAVLLINYSWNTGHPASQPRIFSLFSFFFSSACSPCSACLHLADSRQKPGEQFVTKYSSLLLSVWGFSPFPQQHLLRSSRSPAAASCCLRNQEKTTKMSQKS